MDLQNWLENTPKCTTFRINKMKSFNLDILNNFLISQSKELKSEQIPKCYLLRPDCLVVEQWPEEVKQEPTGTEVVVDAFCAAAVLRGAHIFAPGIVGLPSGCQMNQKVDIYGDLEGRCNRGLKITYEGKKLFVGTGLLKKLRHELFDNGAQPRGIGVHTLLPASRLPVVNETLYPRGVVLLQNLPSIVCGWVVDAKPNEYILDMCAAPGNKTTHLAEMSNDQAHITAIDKSPQRVAKILQSCETQGVTCIKAFTFDSTKCYSKESQSIENGPPFPSNSFDKVLLDGPCSGLGQRPLLRQQMTPKMIQTFKFLQRKLFDAAVQVLKEGGKLVYSTCTVTKEENELMVAWVLDKFPCLKLIPSEPLLGGPGLPDSGLSDEQRVMVQRFGPTIDPLRTSEHIYRESIGFFIAAFTKIPGSI